MELLNVSLGFISKWRHIYEAQGADGLKLGYEGRASYLTPEETEAVIEWLKKGEVWRLEQLRNHLQQEYGVVYKARRSYYDLLKRARISWKKTQKGNPKKDPLQVAIKQAEIKKNLPPCHNKYKRASSLSFFKTNAICCGEMLAGMFGVRWRKDWLCP
jgi:putative transposase